MGHRYNLFWLSQFCVTLGVLWALAPFINAKDGSLLCLVRLVTVMPLAPQPLQLAIGRGWNAFLSFTHFASALWDFSSWCFESSYSVLADSFASNAFILLSLFATTELAALFHYVPTVSIFAPHFPNKLTFAIDSFFLWFFPALRFALFIAPFSQMAAPESFTGSLQDFAQIADDDEDMASEYGSDEDDAPDSPTHPDNDFFSQIAQPGSTPGIISTARMASMPLPVSRTPSRASSSHTVHNPRAGSKPYDKKAPTAKTKSKPSSTAPSRSGSPIPSHLPIITKDWAKFMELLTNWREQSLLYHASFQFKDQYPFPPKTADKAAHYYANIGGVNQEVASIHLASGVLGRFITSAGCDKVEQQVQLLGVDLDAEEIDLLVDSGRKSLSQLLADEHIDLNDIAPSYIPADILVTPVPLSLLLPVLPVP